MRSVFQILFLLFALGPFAGCHPAEVRDSAVEPAQPESRLFFREVLSRELSPAELAGPVWCGPAPQSEAEFDELVWRGVRSVLSVDGARPEVERARTRGLRTVHIPIGYAEITPAETAQLALALRELPRPVYVHCHLGLHRGPAAAGVGLIALGELTPDAGVAFLRRAGTSPAYSGLYSAVSNARPLPSETVTWADPLVEVAETNDRVAVMAAIGQLELNLKQLERAGWVAPRDHPDLVAVAEAGLLRDAFRQLLAAEEIADATEEYRRLMQRSESAAHGLETSLRNQSMARASAQFRQLRALCTECHRAWRD